MIAWHYTTGQGAQQIIRAGVILAQPVAWFSVRSDVDPSACRSVMHAGHPHRLTVGEMRRMFAGWVRFGIKSTELVPADFVRTSARVSRAAWRQWEALARAQGANVRDWFASLEPVALERCQLQRLDGHPAVGAWHTLEDPRAWASAMLDAAIAVELCRVEVAQAG